MEWDNTYDCAKLLWGRIKVRNQKYSAMMNANGDFLWRRDWFNIMESEVSNASSKERSVHNKMVKAIAKSVFQRFLDLMRLEVSIMTSTYIIRIDYDRNCYDHRTDYDRN